MLAASERSKAYARPGKSRCDNSRPTAHRDRAIILGLLDTGLRASELCGLCCSHLDIKNSRLRVLSKGRKERILHISPATAKAIWRYHSSRDDLMDTSAVFASRDGGHMDRNHLRQTLQRIGERAGVPDVTIHRFRHTFAIMFLCNGGTVFALQRLLGHSSLDMVERYVAIAQTDTERAHKEASAVASWRGFYAFGVGLQERNPATCGQRAGAIALRHVLSIANRSVASPERPPSAAGSLIEEAVLHC